MNQQTITTRTNASHFGTDSARPAKGGRNKKEMSVHETSQFTHSNVTELSNNQSKETSFHLEDSEATEVMLLGDFTEWERRPIRMIKGGGGIWHVKVPLAAGQYHYRFLVDGQWRDDPRCREQVKNPYGSNNAVLHVT